jgi:hypothetical protein
MYAILEYRALSDMPRRKGRAVRSPKSNVQSPRAEVPRPKSQVNRAKSANSHQKVRMVIPNKTKELTPKRGRFAFAHFSPKCGRGTEAGVCGPWSVVEGEGARCQVRGARCQVSGAEVQRPKAKVQSQPGEKCEFASKSANGNPQQNKRVDPEKGPIRIRALFPEMGARDGGRVPRDGGWGRGGRCEGRGAEVPGRGSRVSGLWAEGRSLWSVVKTIPTQRRRTRDLRPRIAESPQRRTGHRHPHRTPSADDFSV